MRTLELDDKRDCHNPIIKVSRSLSLTQGSHVSGFRWQKNIELYFIILKYKQGAVYKNKVTNYDISNFAK